MEVYASPHFKWSECTTTAQPFPNVPTEADKIRIRLLLNVVLEPFRAIVGPLKVDSMFRSQAVNKAVGGTPGSQHTTGEAADVVPLKMDKVAAFKALMASSLPVDQAIVYHDKPHLHISYTTRRENRGEFLVCTGPKTYVPWSQYVGPFKP